MLNAKKTMACKMQRILWALSVMMFAGFLSGQEREMPPRSGMEFSLKSAQEYALQHSYDMKNSLLDVATARKKLKETVAGGLPQISAALSYNDNLKLATSLIPNFFEGKPEEKIAVRFGTQHNATFNVSIQQLLFNGSYFVGLQTSKIYTRLAEQNHRLTQLDIKETVTSTYQTILVAEESAGIVSSSLENLEKTLYEIRERYKEGFVAETDADLVQISVGALKSTLQTVLRQRDVAYKLLNYQLGLSLETPITLTDTLEMVLRRVDVDKKAAQVFDLEQNIEYQILNTQEKLGEMALKNEKSAYLPTISAFFTYQQMAMRDSFNFFSPEGDWFPLQILGVTINLPVFASGRRKAKVAQAAINLEKARNAKRQADQGLKLQAAQARSNFLSAHESYLNAEENMALSQKVYEVTLIKYKEGVASSMELTQANDKFLAGQSGYIQAVLDLLNAKNTLDRISNTY